MRKRIKNNPNKDANEDQRNKSAKYEEYNNEEKEDDSLERNWLTDLQICGCTGTLLLVLYVFTLHPSVPGGDSGELIVSAFELGVAHPPGYPLFTMLSKLVMTVIPIRSPAWRVNLLNAFFSAVSGALLQLSVLRLTSCVGSSLLAIGLFSLNRLTWNWSVSAEVFGLNNLFSSLLMLLAVIIDITPSNKPDNMVKAVYALAVVCGLALTNQHTIVVYVACISLWSLMKLKKAKALTFAVLVKSACFGVLGLTPYIYLPVSSYLNIARWTWGDQRTFSGFLTHLLRQEYGTFDLGKDQLGSGFSVGLSAYGTHLQSHMCELCPWLALIGLVASISWFAIGKHSCTLVFSLMTILYTALFMWRANLDLSNPLFKGVVERFWMQSDIVIVLLACVGFYTAVRMVTEKFLGSAKLSMTSIFTTMGAGILIVLQLKNYRFCDNSANLVVNTFARSILDQMPRNAIVLTKGDLPTNSLRYLHLCENVRRDLQIVDVEVLSYQWSLPMLKKFYPKVKFPGDFWQLVDADHPDGRRSFNFKTFLDSNYNRYPLFACIGMQERDPSWQKHYQLWPFGVCSKIESVDQKMEPLKWGNYTGGFADKWMYAFDGFDATSWEKVANDEMWHSKIGTAFYMYKKAEEVEDVAMKAALLTQSYELYFRAIKVNQKPSKMSHVESFPSFWHKNFALVCERLLHVDPLPGLDKVRLCKLSIYHFQQYVHMNPKDSDNGRINEAIGILKQRLDMYEKLDRVDKTLENSAKRAEKLQELNNVVSAAAGAGSSSARTKP